MSAHNQVLQHILILGAGEEAQQLIHLCRSKFKIVGIKVKDAQASLNNLENVKIFNEQENHLSDISMVIVTSDYLLSKKELEKEICDYLQQGINVISIQQGLDHKSINKACIKGKAKFQITNLFPSAILQQCAMTLSKALSRLDKVKVTQAVVLQKHELNRPYIQALGFGKSKENFQTTLLDLKASYHQSLINIVTALFPDNNALEFKVDIKTVVAERDIESVNIAKNTIVSLQICQVVYRHNLPILEIQEQWCVDADYLDHTQAHYGSHHHNLNFNLQVHGEPSLIDAQIEFTDLTSGGSALAVLNAQAVLNIISILSAQTESGIYTHQNAPRYQVDQRLEGVQPYKIAKQTSEQGLKKVIIWGPGEIGGSVVRAILDRPHIKIVGAKVFSPHKKGQDLGELVGTEKLGIYATDSTKDLLDLDADYVIVTPQPRAIVEGLDQQVLEILKAGKNVITSAAYHNVTMPNWLINAQKPTQLLAEAIHTHGIAKNKNEERAFKLLKKLEHPLAKIPVLKKFRPVVDQALSPIFNKLMPPRALPEDLNRACVQGQSFLHGTGVHPSFMAERIGIMLANFLAKPQHMRFIEAVDFSYMPDGMWGGLNTIGFGLPVDKLDANFIVAKAGDFYYGDVTGNVGHLLFGVSNQEIRVERRFRAIPAKEDFKVGSTLIKKGHAAALHMMHLGYIGDHHFFTNEECWYLGPNEEFRGENLPFGNFETPISYAVEVTDESSQQLKMQLSMDGSGRFAEILQQAQIETADQRCALGQVFREEGVTNPITNATAMAILDAIEGIEANSVGIMIDDIRPRVKKMYI